MDGGVRGVPVSHTQIESDEMDWDAYAEHYDVMCELNPSYQENLGRLTKYVSGWQLPDDANICDLGAGTGNYISALSDLLPNARFTHLDFDPKMNKIARNKYSKGGLANVTLVEQPAQQAVFEPATFDLIVCINALYAISPQTQMLRKIRQWLTSDGLFFVIDFGRKQRTIDWMIYLFRESMKNHQVGTYAKALIESREVIKQNRRSAKGQSTGRYWTHSTSQFGRVLSDCGFAIDELYTCYRGYADLAICRRA